MKYKILINHTKKTRLHQGHCHGVIFLKLNLVQRIPGVFKSEEEWPKGGMALIRKLAKRQQTEENRRLKTKIVDGVEVLVRGKKKLQNNFKIGKRVIVLCQNMAIKKSPLRDAMHSGAS